MSKFDFATHDGVRRPVSLKPKASAAATILSSPTFTPIPAITVLHDHRMASVSEASAQPVASLGKHARTGPGGHTWHTRCSGEVGSALHLTLGWGRSLLWAGRRRLACNNGP